MFLSHHLVLKGLPSLPPQLIRFDYLRRGECRYYTSNTVQKKVGKQPDKSKSHAKAKSKSPSSSKVVPSEVDKAGPLPAVSSNQRLVSLNPKSPHLHNTRGEGILKSEIQSNRVSIDIKKERPSEATIQHGTYIAETTWKDIPACRSPADYRRERILDHFFYPKGRPLVQLRKLDFPQTPTGLEASAVVKQYWRDSMASNAPEYDFGHGNPALGVYVHMGSSWYDSKATICTNRIIFSRNHPLGK